MNDEAKVASILADLAAKRTASESAEYDFFFRSPHDTQEMVYHYWLEHKDMADAPRYLIDYIEAKKYD